VTSSVAYMGFHENELGSLEVGKLADLAVLDRDYLSCPEEQIRHIKVLATLVGGRVVHGTLP
jgi:predicted amidohydrolase YtcJ